MTLRIQEAQKDDSPNLTDEEVASSIDTSSKKDVTASITPMMTCATCGTKDMARMWHAVFRKKPSIYWRCTVTCANGHTFQKTHRVDWLRTDSDEGVDGQAWGSMLHLS